MHIVFWQRMHLAGHDASRFLDLPEGWLIEGMAVFAQRGARAAFCYRLRCDRQWRSREALIGGWAGERDSEISIERTTAGAWRINGRENAALIGIEDIDLGFTPGSNTNAIRRLNLRTVQGAESVAAWLDPED